MPKRPVPSPAAKAPPVPDGKGANSLRLSAAELEAVHEILEKSSNHEAGRRRQSARLAYTEISVPIDICQPGGGQTRITVACRNLSQNGMGFLHSAYLHVGTKAHVTLPHKTRKEVRVTGEVVRCRHVMRHIHEVGVRFEHPINVRDHVELDSLAQSFTCEVVDPARLKGALLIVDEYKVEAACLQSMLRETGMEFETAASIDEGVQAATRGADIVLCDHLFESGTAADFVLRARRAGVRCPILVMSADQSPEARRLIREARADGLLAKPLTQDTLLRALAEFTLVPRSRGDLGSPLYSTLPPDSPMAALADTFAKDLRTVGDQVRDCAAKADLEGLRRRVLRVAGPAQSLGFDTIGVLARELLTALASTGSLDECQAQLNQFITACRHVRPSPSSAAA
jgi:CheY-like chemotaxis protein